MHVFTPSLKWHDHDIARVPLWILRLVSMDVRAAPESFIGRHLRQTGPEGVDVSGAAAASSS